MKTPILKQSLLFIIIVVSAIFFLTLNSFLLFGQNAPIIIRGHFDDDFYVAGAPNRMYYFSEFGAHLQMQNTSNYFPFSMTSEPSAGEIYSHNMQQFGESIDYGKSFHQFAPFVSDYTSIEDLYGGEILEEFIVLGFDYVANHYVLYKTVDNFASFLLVDVNSNIENGEIGHLSGELFQMPVRTYGALLLHSLDFGYTFDTLTVDNSIINVTQNRYLYTLSHGSQQGELFLVVNQPVSPTEIHYNIYHTTDYGTAWQLKSTQVFDSQRQQFTAGRGACTFYIANLKATPNSTYYTLQVLSSADCGETFTTYEHMLTPDVGLQENALAGDNKVTITPNPASKKITMNYQLAKSSEMEIAVYNSTGQCVLRTTSTPEDGYIEKTIDVEILKQGLYSVQLQSGGLTVASGKFIVAR